MAKLTDVRDTPEIANGAKVIAVPVKGSTTIYQGALVALDADGYAIPGKKAENLTAVGRAEETVANAGAVQLRICIFFSFIAQPSLWNSSASPAEMSCSSAVMRATISSTASGA